MIWTDTIKNINSTYHLKSQDIFLDQFIKFVIVSIICHFFAYVLLIKYDDTS